MKFKYTGTSPLLMSIDGKLQLISAGAVISGSAALRTTDTFEEVVKKSVKTTKAKGKIDGDGSKTSST